MKSLNTLCPWSRRTVCADSLTQYRGHTVGFCNPGCRDKFDRATRQFEQAMVERGRHGPFKAGLLRAAHYNRWFNRRLYRVVDKLPKDIFYRDLGAFFTSIHGTLNHILVWDITWLQRFASSRNDFASLNPALAMPKATSHDQILYHKRTELHDARRQMDEVILAFVTELAEEDHAKTLQYTVASGEVFRKNFGGMLQHLFNHQTHHRGQITALLYQQGVDPGTTDLLATLVEIDKEDMI